MNVLEARVVLRDRSLLDVVDLALRFLVLHAKPFAALSALVLVPSFAVTYAIARAAGWGWGWSCAMALAPFASAPFTALASRLVFEKNARLGAAIKAAATALPALIAVRFLEVIAVSAGAMFLLAPAVWLLALFFFTNEVCVLERAGVGAAMSRLSRLLSGNTGDAIMAVLFLTALHIIAVFLGDAVGHSILEDLLEITPPAPMTASKGTAMALASFWLFVPFFATCRFLVYVNARTRAEGWDVQTRFAAIAARAGEEA